MALSMPGLIVMPKMNMVQSIPSCKSNQHQAMIMLQPHHDRMHARNISHSIICGAKRPPISTGGGGQINETKISREQNVSDLTSSNTDQKDGKKSKEDVTATPKKTGSTD
ncbi:uncharacterized protein Pyn_02722 [Prunus yedoensis var. nudiflora]|uniref:Uncharacterized protein n=1 Tax=Prunus yedoensis var. nudiflora TaxID=2094558 RepID=A0A314URN8_PRUYE|nr:uncharacterized protein Pyn_02722 [Prunus yedoensis var. nudiflora]